MGESEYLDIYPVQSCFLLVKFQLDDFKPLLGKWLEIINFHPFKTGCFFGFQVEVIYIYIYIWASYSDQLTAEVGHPKIVVSLVRKSNQNARNIQVMFFCELCGSLDPWDSFIYLHLP